MNIYTLICSDHAKAKAIMHEIQGMPDSEHEKRLELFYPLKVDLLTHNESEEETFYVALMEHSKTKKDAKHSEHEHHEAADMLDELDGEEMKPAEWRAKFDDLCQALLHHMKNEEECVFGEAKEVLSEKMAVQLGAEMERLKKVKKPLARHEHDEKHMHH